MCTLHTNMDEELIKMTAIGSVGPRQDENKQKHTTEEDEFRPRGA